MILGGGWYLLCTVRMEEKMKASMLTYAQQWENYAFLGRMQQRIGIGRKVVSELCFLLFLRENHRSVQKGR